MKQLKSLLLMSLAVALGALYLVPAPQASAVSSSSLSIAPKKNYIIEPGDSINDTLNIRNVDNSTPLDLTMRVIDFSYDGLGGTPKLLLSPDAPQTTWSLRSYMNVPKTVTIAPGQTKQVDMDIKIPAGHGAGSYYSAIIYSSGSGEGGNVGLNASGVTLVFVNIPGKVTEDLKLVKFGAYDRVAQGELSGYRYFNVKKPDTMAYTLKNSGNVTESPVGSITLRDIFGRTTTINNVNPTGSLALIGQTRTFTSCVKLKAEKVEVGGVASKSAICDTPDLWPGYYRLSLNLFYGQNGNMTQEITKSGGFWYMPWWFVFVSIAVIAVLSYYIWRGYRGLQDKFYGPRTKKSTPRRRK